MELGGADIWIDWPVCRATRDFVERWLRLLWPDAVLEWDPIVPESQQYGHLFAFKDQATVDLEAEVGITDEVGARYLYIILEEAGVNIAHHHTEECRERAQELASSIRANRGLI